MNHSKISDKKLLSQYIPEEKETNKETGEELKKLKELLQQRDNEISILCEEKIIFGFELIWLQWVLCVRDRH